jgi:hypothetical protein
MIIEHDRAGRRQNLRGVSRLDGNVGLWPIVLKKSEVSVHGKSCRIANNTFD